MSYPSNSYAEKIYSEHPIALWALDDQADYVSLIDESKRDLFSNWTIDTGTFFESSNLSDDPFSNSMKTLLKADVPAVAGLFTTLKSPNILNFSDLNTSLGTFALSTYFYSDSVYLEEIQIGYEYVDPDTLETIQNVKGFKTSAYQRWSFISETFDIISVDAEFKMIIKLRFFPGAGTEDDYQVYINGITIGQWSEEFNSGSLGLNVSLLPSSIALPSSDVIEAKEYQVSGNSGYYFVSNNSILARNSGIPLVYGAANVTKLVPNNTSPSLIIPGKGFLNKAGQYNDYTVEFWLRINCQTNEPVRIFGPIASADGLYVESGFLTLVIGDKFKSHFIGEWYRPMLVHIRLIRDAVSLLVNGEEVLSFTLDTKTLSLPNILDESSKTQDWLGFYATQDTTPFEVDCISVYSYNVPITVAKRRWVYGQAVLSPEKIDSSYNGISAFIDYSFANYVANYTYPDFAKWEQGTFDNILTTTSALTTPQYSLPGIFLGSKSLQNLYSDCQDIQTSGDKFITFRPNSTWNDEICYFNFPKFNIINDEVHAIYGIFQINEDDESQQILFKIYNTLTGNSFSIKKDGDYIHYYLVYNGIEEEIYAGDAFIVGEKLVAGIDILTLSNYFGGNVASFFGNRNGLIMYIAGDETGEEQFVGYIYKIAICSALNKSLIQNNFNEVGTIDSLTHNNFTDHLASYTLFPEVEYNQYYLDIASYGYWEDYLPLSYFAKTIKNERGEDFYSLDFLQFNVNYPASTKTITVDDIEYVDTQAADVRSYVTFQYTADGANLLNENFTENVLPNKDGILIVDNYLNWQTTKFEVVDNTVIYPPTSVDFNNLAIVYSLELKNQGTTTKQIFIKRLDFSSQAFNQNSFNSIGTRFGINLFPYKRSGIYYDYKTKNPFSIYKSNTPYLYLTKNSGIEIRPYSDNSERGITMPVNSQNANNYKINAVQLWTMLDRNEFLDTPEKLFQIEYKDDTIICYAIANSSQKDRAKIYARKKSTGEIFNGLAFYLNGSLVTEPVITAKEWNVIGMTFANSLSFNSFVGKVTLNGNFVFNNIATYQASSLQEIQSKITRPWFNVKTNGTTMLDWQFWANSYVWDGVLVISSREAYAINPQDIYKTYIGSNKIIIDDSEGMIFDAESIKIHTNTLWYPEVHTPV